MERERTIETNERGKNSGNSTYSSSFRASDWGGRGEMWRRRLNEGFLNEAEL